LSARNMTYRHDRPIGTSPSREQGLYIPLGVRVISLFGIRLFHAALHIDDYESERFVVHLFLL